MLRLYVIAGFHVFLSGVRYLKFQLRIGAKGRRQFISSKGNDGPLKRNTLVANAGQSQKNWRSPRFITILFGIFFERHIFASVFGGAVSGAVGASPQKLRQFCRCVKNGTAFDYGCRCRSGGICAARRITRNTFYKVRSSLWIFLRKCFHHSFY